KNVTNVHDLVYFSSPSDKSTSQEVLQNIIRSTESRFNVVFQCIIEILSCHSQLLNCFWINFDLTSDLDKSVHCRRLGGSYQAFNLRSTEVLCSLGQIIQVNILSQLIVLLHSCGVN